MSLCAAILAALQFKGLRTIIMRRYYDELEQYFITRFLDMFPSDVFGYNYNKKHRIATFANKSRIVFRAAKTLEDARKHLGLEYQFEIVDEANQFEEEVFTYMRGSLRNASNNKFIPTLLMTGNPGGLSDPWFKSHFISPDYKQWLPEELKHKDKFVFLPSSVHDNPTLMKDAHYIDMLDSLPEHYRRAWLEGDWDVFQGQFFEEWSSQAHIVEPFPIPDTWDKVAGMDLGGTKRHPTVLLKLAQDPDTLDVYVYEEYSDYGSVEKYIYYVKRLLLNDNLSMIYADPSAWSNNIKLRESDISAARIFASEGVPLQKANNDRVNGWRVVKAWLHWTETKSPKLKIFNTCDGLIKTMPNLKYTTKGHKAAEDLDTEMADDYADALRYALMSGFQFPSKSLLAENQGIVDRATAGAFTQQQIYDRFISTKMIPYSGKTVPIKYKDKKERFSWV